MALVGLLLLSEHARGPGRGEGRRIGPTRLVASALLGLAYLGFGTASTHDDLAWNRARWEAGRSLLEEPGLGPGAIPGGFEFDRFHLWRDWTDGMPRPGKPGWMTNDEIARPRFTLAFGEQGESRLVGCVPVDRWLPWTPEEILILEQPPDDSTPDS